MFEVGQHVVCVNANPKEDPIFVYDTRLIVNKVYTIGEVIPVGSTIDLPHYNLANGKVVYIGKYTTDHVGVRLQEISQAPIKIRGNGVTCQCVGLTMPYSSSRFRPLKKLKIEDFVGESNPFEIKVGDPVHI